MYIITTLYNSRFQCSSVVERPLMMRWVVGSIPLVGSIKLFLDPAGVKNNNNNNNIEVNSGCLFNQ